MKKHNIHIIFINYTGHINNVFTKYGLKLS